MQITGTRNPDAIFEFGRFRVDSAQKLLLRDGEVLPLPAKAFDLLLALIENDGLLVSRDDLLKRVWPDTFVEEANLAKGIHLLRKTLGDGVIETFPKRGYRFTAPPVAHIIHQETEIRVRGGQEAHTRKRRWLIMTGFLSLAAVAAAWSVIGNRHSRIDSVAVVPFQISGTDDPLLASGFTQELTARLQTLQGLRVVSPHFVSDVRELGHRLAVQTVLTGALHYSGGRLRATAQLFSARDGSVLWAEGGQDTEGGDLSRAEQVLASAIASRLRGRVISTERGRLQRRGSTSTEAWDAFLRGRALIIHNWMDDAAGYTPRARAYFERAARLDPGFADAWAWLGLAQEAEFFQGKMPRSHLETAIENAHRALSIDPDNIAARRTLIYAYDSTGQNEDALREAKRAQEIDPKDPEGMLASARAYFRASMLDRATNLYERYLMLYPDDEGARSDLLTLCVFADAWARGIRAAQPALAAQRLFYPAHLLYANSGDFTRAVPLARQSLHPPFHVDSGYFAGVVLKAAGLHDEAERTWLAVIDRMNQKLNLADNERTRMWLAMTCAQVNQPEQANSQIVRALALNPGDPWILFFASETEALLGNRAAAIDYLRQSVSRGFRGLHYLDYYQKPLYGWHRYRSDPEFRAIRDGLARKIADLRSRY